MPHSAHSSAMQKQTPFLAKRSIATKMKSGFVNLPEFRGFVGDYPVADSGAGDWTLFAFLTNYSAITPEHGRLLIELATFHGMALRRAGSTQVIGQPSAAPDCHNNILCIALLDDDEINLVTLFNAPNTGQGGPRGVFGYEWDSTPFGASDRGEVHFPDNSGRILTRLIYDDLDPNYGIGFGWAGP